MVPRQSCQAFVVSASLAFTTPFQFDLDGVSLAPLPVGSVKVHSAYPSIWTAEFHWLTMATAFRLHLSSISKSGGAEL